jgi:hypothetical protein
MHDARVTYYVRDSFGDSPAAVIERDMAHREWEAISQSMRDALADAFDHSMACDFEAAAIAAGAVGPRKGAGLVSASTTAKRSGRSRSQSPLNPLHRAKAQARAEAQEATPAGPRGREAQHGVYMPPNDGDSMRVRHLRRAVGFSARCQGVSEKGHRSDDVLMLTLTYREGGDWRPEHVKRLLDRYRMWMKGKGVPCRYVWVAELQQRGAIHYHVAFWVPHGFKVPMADRAGWWPHGSTRIELARNAVPYLMKYLSKGSDKAGCWRLPQGARMYGVGGLEHAFRRARRWLGLPAFVRARASHLCDWKRAPGGGWVDPDGVIWPSEWKRARCGAFLAFERLHDHGRPFEADGPFSWLPGVVHPGELSSTRTV